MQQVLSLFTLSTKIFSSYFREKKTAKVGWESCNFYFVNKNGRLRFTVVYGLFLLILKVFKLFLQLKVLKSKFENKFTNSRFASWNSQASQNSQVEIRKQIQSRNSQSRNLQKKSKFASRDSQTNSLSRNSQSRITKKSKFESWDSQTNSLKSKFASRDLQTNSLVEIH